MRKSILIILTIAFSLFVYSNVLAQKQNVSTSESNEHIRNSRLNSFNELSAQNSMQLKECVDQFTLSVENIKKEISEGKISNTESLPGKFATVLKSAQPCLKLIDDDNEMYKETTVLIKLTYRYMDDAKVTERKEPSALLKSIVQVKNYIYDIRQGFNTVLNDLVYAESIILRDSLLMDVETSASHIDKVLKSLEELSKNIDKLSGVIIKY